MLGQKLSSGNKTIIYELIYQMQFHTAKKMKVWDKDKFMIKKVHWESTYIKV